MISITGLATAAVTRLFAGDKIGHLGTDSRTVPEVRERLSTSCTKPLMATRLDRVVAESLLEREESAVEERYRYGGSRGGWGDGGW